MSLMTDPQPDLSKPWLPYVGVMVMAGLTLMLEIDAFIAAALGSDAIFRVSLQTGCSFGFAALGGLIYAVRKSRRTSS
jgi:hypothetical protein